MPDGQVVYSQRNGEFRVDAQNGFGFGDRFPAAVEGLSEAICAGQPFDNSYLPGTRRNSSWPRQWRSCTFDGMGRALEKFRLALLASLSHDVFGIAKGAAYSAILCLFPTILVLTTLLALTPESDTLRGEMRAAFAEVLPADTMTLLHAYFTNQKVRSEQVLVSAIVVSLVAAMGMMHSLMEGFRRAYELPRREWSFWVERVVALVLVPLCLVPMAFATVMVAFGHQIEQWVVSNSYHVLGPLVLFIWRIVRWSIGLFTTIVVLAVIYQFGTPRRRAWKYVLPGASGAAIIWFLATLGFGFYLTRFADYSVVYGPLGAVVATLVWLYISTVSVLIGAEFNAHIFPKPQRSLTPGRCRAAGRKPWSRPAASAQAEAGKQLRLPGPVQIDLPSTGRPRPPRASTRRIELLEAVTVSPANAVWGTNEFYPDGTELYPSGRPTPPGQDCGHPWPFL